MQVLWNATTEPEPGRASGMEKLKIIPFRYATPSLPTATPPFVWLHFQFRKLPHHSLQTWGSWLKLKCFCTRNARPWVIEEQTKRQKKTQNNNIKKTHGKKHKTGKKGEKLGNTRTHTHTHKSSPQNRQPFIGWWLRGWDGAAVFEGRKV